MQRAKTSPFSTMLKSVQVPYFSSLHSNMISNECSLRIVPPSHCPGHFGGSHPTRGRQAGQLQPTMLRLVDCEPFARRLHQTAAAFSSGVPSNPPAGDK